jgi:hypothetical protein
MALPAMRARARRGVSPSIWSHWVRISMTDRVGQPAGLRTGARLSSSRRLGWCRFLSQTAVHRIAPHGNGLQHRKVNRPVEDSIPGTADPS